MLSVTVSSVSLFMSSLRAHFTNRPQFTESGLTSCPRRRPALCLPRVATMILYWSGKDWMCLTGFTLDMDTLEELSLFSHNQGSQILPLRNRVPVYFLFRTGYNHLAADDYSIRKIRLNSSLGQTEAWGQGVFVKEQAFIPFTNMPARQRLTASPGHSLAPEEWLPAFRQPPSTFPELWLSFNARRLSSWYIFLQGAYIFP